VEIPLKLKYRTPKPNAGGAYRPRTNSKGLRNRQWQARHANRPTKLVIAEMHYCYAEQKPGYKHPGLVRLFGGM